jgi:hypothetical protein
MLEQFVPTIRQVGFGSTAKDTEDYLQWSHQDDKMHGPLDHNYKRRS